MVDVRRLTGPRHRLVWLTLVLALLLPLSAPFAQTAAPTLPARLSDRDYWTMVEEFSEESGYFQSDNLVSNERRFQEVVPALRKFKRGGVYLGVAPDQNFTYIVSLEPRMAFIVDIRRANLIVHLMYKAIFELSADRADFLSRLFSRKRPAGLTASTSAVDLFSAYHSVESSDALFKDNIATIEHHLTRTRGFVLSEDDLRSLQYSYSMFRYYGPDLTYASSSGRGRNMPTFADLQTSTDLEGINRAYLGSEETYRVLKTLQERNLLVPVVGDFAGTKALRSVGKYLTDRGATVTAFYTSNVEQYLFQNGVWRGFYDNVAALPLDDSSTFIRSARGLDVLDPIRLLLKDYSDGRVVSYSQVTSRGDIR